MAFAIEKEERFAAYNAQMCLVHSRRVREQLGDDFEDAQLAREGRDREATAGLKSKPFPLLTCGLVAGIRHCHTPDATDHSGRQLHFSDSRTKTVRMIQTWVSAGVRLGINLGNVVDQRCGIQRKHEIALQNIKGVLCDDYKTGTWRFRMQHHHQENKFRADILHVFGEHDLQHFSLEQLVSSFNLPAVRPEEDCLYYSTPCPGGWRLIFLDTNDVSTRSSLRAKRDEARKWLEKARKPGRHALVSNCGAVGARQLDWLREELSRARAAGERAVLCSHSPLNEMVARQGGDAELVCWNYKQVMDVIFSVSGVVVCCISGQQLDGGYSVDDMTRKGRGRVHHIAIRNAITEPSDKACFGILEFFENSIVLQGYGGVNSITVSCPTEEEAKNIHAREVAQVAQVKAEAELLRHREVFAAKQANEQVLKEAMEKEEEAALAVDAENRRLWLIAEEAAALERKREQERLAAFYAGEAGEKLGLKWEEVGADKPHSGAEIKNAALYAALREKLEFTKEEFKRFQVGNVTHTSYIKVDDMYFKPSLKGLDVEEGQGGADQKVGEREDLDEEKKSAEDDTGAGGKESAASLSK